MSENLTKRQHAVKQGVEEICAAYGALVDQVVTLAGVIEVVGNDLARLAGQTLARWQVLEAVAREAAPVGSIARALGHTRQSVQRVADLLVDDGLARYLPNPAHQRAKLLEMTPSGRAAQELVRDAQSSCSRRAAEGLDPAALDSAREVLGELQRRLEAQMF